MSLTVRSLHTRPDLIASCARLLKTVWPCARTERLQHLESENCTGFPCSLVIVEHKENRQDSVIGHVRLVPVKFPVEPKSVWIEAGCIDQSRRAQGLYSKLLSFADKYALEELHCQQAFGWAVKDLFALYKRFRFVEYPKFSVRAVGSNALEVYGTPEFWSKDTPPPVDMEFAPDGSIISRQLATNVVMMKKTLIW